MAQIERKNNVSHVYDCDGVLASSEVAVIEAAYPLLGKRLRPKDFNNWNYLSQVALKVTGSQQKADEITNLWFDPVVLGQSLAYPDARTVASYFYHRWGADQFVVTTRKPDCRQSTVSWVEEENNYPWIKRERVRLREDSSITGDEFKVKQIVEIYPALILEDNAETVRYFKKNLPPELFANVRMVNRPWNRRETEGIDRKIRIDRWTDLLSPKEKIGLARFILIKKYVRN